MSIFGRPNSSFSEVARARSGGEASTNAALRAASTQIRDLEGETGPLRGIQVGIRTGGIAAEQLTKLIGARMIGIREVGELEIKIAVDSAKNALIAAAIPVKAAILIEMVVMMLQVRSHLYSVEVTGTGSVMKMRKATREAYEAMHARGECTAEERDDLIARAEENSGEMVRVLRSNIQEAGKAMDDLQHLGTQHISSLTDQPNHPAGSE